MSKYKAKFQDTWVNDDRYSQWVQKCDDLYSARCKVCSKIISVAGLGVKALDKHAEGIKHKQRIPVGDNKIKKSCKPAIPQETPTSSVKLEQTSIVSATESQFAKEAEKMWAIDVVLSKHSFRSCAKKSELFSAMFHDSEIAKKISCGKTKCTYLICFGVAPFFKELLCKTLSELDHVVCQFDESYNQVVKKSQMDLHVRYWDTSMNIVRTRYYNSEFLGKAAATCMSGLDENMMLQVSMDGPHLNTSFLSLLNAKRKDDELSLLISIGTCGLHTMHCSFKHGENATGWKLKKLLSSIYKIFHESPSRRSDYEKLTEAQSSDYPLQFCSHRWVENERVAKRGREVWQKTIAIVDYWKGLAKSKQPGQGKPGQNTSYEHLCSHYKDVLVPVKLQFFEEIAKLLNSFLVVFQTDNPMAAFLAETLEKLLRQLCSKFIRKEVLSAASTTLSLLKVDVTEAKNQISVSKLYLGFAVKYELQQLKSARKVTDVQIHKFKTEACQFLVALCKHMMEKSPLNSFFARCLICLSPIYMVESPEACELLFDRLLMKLVTYKKVSASVADKAKLQYSDFISTVVKENRDEFLGFKKETDRLDTFLFKYAVSSKFVDLAEIFKMLLILAHGQAQVERGFSVNDQLLDDNMLTGTLVAQRIVHDHMCSEKLKAHQVTMTPTLHGHVKEARKRYFANQKERSLKTMKTDREAKLETINEEIADSNQQIHVLESTIVQLKADADKFSFQVERQTSLDQIKSTISKSNALKRAATEKQESLNKIVAKKRMLMDKKTEI